jgi:alcohol dehydrogenase
MQLSFSYNMPVRILFGAGKLKELSTTPYLPGKKALIVIGATGAMKKYGYLDKVSSYLKKRSVDFTVFDKILPNPISEHVEEGAEVAKNNGCDFVLGLGGGSTIDSAKSIAVMAKNPGKYWDYINGGSGKGLTPKNGALPVVAIPTTAGTGTEADPWTVITKSGAREKIGWGNDSTYPVLSIVDPELMTSVPPKFTGYTGMDTFFHASEAYLATVNQPASDHLALEAVGLIAKYLPKAVKNGKDLEARAYIAWACTEAGICESLSSCISHHSMEHAVSAFYPEVPHGAGLTMLSVEYFRYLIEKGSSTERFINMARVMGENVDSLSETEKPLAFIKALKMLIKDSGLVEETLSSYGVKRSDIKALSENSFQTMGGLYNVTPIKLTVDDVSAIYERCFD